MAREDSELLRGVVDIDETYVGSKPRRQKGNKNDDDYTPSMRGKGTKKTSVVGPVVRNGNVKARVMSKLSG